MKKFVMTRNLFNGDEYNACREFETEQEFLDWAATKKHLGKINWSLPKYIDEDGTEHFPDGCERDDQGNPIEVMVNHPEAVGEDMDGNPIVTPAWSETKYKMPDQWSYTFVDISAEMELEAVIEARKEAYQAAGLDMNKFVEYLTENNTEKIAEYRAMKAQIKSQYPKP